MSYRIAVVVGSLRRESFNRKLADALAALAPPELQLRARARSTTCRCTTRTTTPTRRSRCGG